MTRASPTRLDRLREWCEANGVKFSAAKSYKYKNGLTIDQTIAYYQSDRETLASLCRRHGVSRRTAESYKQRTKCTKLEAVEHCLRIKSGEPKRPKAAKRAAARSIEDKDKAAQTDKKPIPAFHPALTRAWV